MAIVVRGERNESGQSDTNPERKADVILNLFKEACAGIKLAL